MNTAWAEDGASIAAVNRSATLWLEFGPIPNPGALKVVPVKVEIGVKVFPETL